MAESFAHDSTSSKHKEAKGGNLPHMAAFKERSRPASSCASVLPLSSESFECSATAEGSVLFPLPVPAHNSTLPAENSINPSLKEAKGGSPSHMAAKKRSQLVSESSSVLFKSCDEPNRKTEGQGTCN